MPSIRPIRASILTASLSYWSIENKFNWIPDVAFKEDQGRTRKEHSVRNLATTHRSILIMLKREQTKMPINTKRLKGIRKYTPSVGRLAILTIYDFGWGG